jgi:hypothetical protein
MKIDVLGSVFKFRLTDICVTNAKIEYHLYFN